MSNIILECRDLSKKYGSFEALKNLNFSLERGKIVGLLGPNGSGKTTLIKIANELLNPTSGEILIDGIKPGVETKLKVSYLSDCIDLPDWMKISELMKFYSDFYTNFNSEKAYKMLENLSLDCRQKFKALSKGNKEKVQLILAMSREAEIYLLDEPMGGVDPATRDYILNTIIANYNENATVVISTHLIADVEKILDDVLFINNGEIVIHKTVDEIRNEKSMSVDAFFREVFKC